VGLGLPSCLPALYPRRIARPLLYVSLAAADLLTIAQRYLYMLVVPSFLHAAAGWRLSARVCQAVPCGCPHQTSGLGGDLLLRAVYLPATWPARVEVAEAAGSWPGQPAEAAGSCGPREGRLATGGCGEGQAGSGAAGAAATAALGELLPTDVAGPLCFQVMGAWKGRWSATG
jgi:hypothetical protein